MHTLIESKQPHSALPLPKTVCLPLSHDVITVVMKNWEPLVLGPALAMLSSPGVSCFRIKFSSYKIAYTAVIACSTCKPMHGAGSSIKDRYRSGTMLSFDFHMFIYTRRPFGDAQNMPAWQDRTRASHT